MGNYIVRIYRSNKKNPHNIVGVVEEVGEEGKRAFTNYDELWDILHTRKGEQIQSKIRKRSEKTHCINSRTKDT